MTRLIDADALNITTITTDDYSGNEVLDVVLKEDIDNAPTVERPQGEWIRDNYGDTFCSHCGVECPYNEEGLYTLGHYCHHCGADMREADNDKVN